MAEQAYIDNLVIENALVVEEHTVVVSTEEVSSIVVEESSPESVVLVDDVSVVCTSEEIAPVIVESSQGIPGPAGPVGEEESGPVFTYLAGKLVRVDYASGNYKTLEYSIDGKLATVRYVKGAVVKVRTFIYSDGVLARIEDTEE